MIVWFSYHTFSISIFTLVKDLLLLCIQRALGTLMEHQQVFTVYFMSMLQSPKLQYRYILSLLINFGRIVSSQELFAE